MIRERVAFQLAYTWRYMLMHPSIAWRWAWYEACDFFERGMYGVAKRDTSSLDGYVSLIMIYGLEVLKGGHGVPLHPTRHITPEGCDFEVPDSLTSDEWISILDSIRDGLLAHKALVDLEYNIHDQEQEATLKARYERGMDELKAWFGNLWD